MTLCTVIAFDPGGTTGWCVMGVKPTDLTHPGSIELEQAVRVRGVFSTGQLDTGTGKGHTGTGAMRGHDGLNFNGEDEGVDRMIGITNRYPETPIVLEDFILDFKKADAARHTLAPVRVIAKFSYALRQEWLDGSRQRDYEESIFIQGRSLAKTTCTDERLKYWGLYNAATGAHARDALRHAYYFLRTCRGTDTDAQLRRHLAWPHIFPDPVAVAPKPKRQAKVGERIEGL